MAKAGPRPIWAGSLTFSVKLRAYGLRLAPVDCVLRQGLHDEHGSAREFYLALDVPKRDARAVRMAVVAFLLAS